MEKINRKNQLENQYGKSMRKFNEKKNNRKNNVKINSKTICVAYAFQKKTLYFLLRSVVQQKKIPDVFSQRQQSGKQENGRAALSCST